MTPRVGINRFLVAGLVAGGLAAAPAEASHPCQFGQSCISHPVPDPQVISVPEPGTAALMALGAVGLALRLRRRRPGRRGPL